MKRLEVGALFDLHEAVEDLVMKSVLQECGMGTLCLEERDDCWNECQRTSIAPQKQGDKKCGIQRIVDRTAAGEERSPEEDKVGQDLDNIDNHPDEVEDAECNRLGKSVGDSIVVADPTGSGEEDIDVIAESFHMVEQLSSHLANKDECSDTPQVLADNVHIVADNPPLELAADNEHQLDMKSWVSAVSTLDQSVVAFHRVLSDWDTLSVFCYCCVLFLKGRK